MLNLAKIQRVVIKVGSNMLTGNNGLDLNVFANLGNQIACLKKNGREVILVTSGATATGMHKMGFSDKPAAIPPKQALAAIGQARLMWVWDHALDEHQITGAQMLLTAEDFEDTTRSTNAKNALLQLLSWGVVPIINENDSVAVEEFKLGDNDNLSALIALLSEADLLINLSDIDGLYDKDPRQHKDAVLLQVVPNVSRETEAYAGGVGTSVGTGGMLTKIKAAQKTHAAGIPMVIAAGSEPDVLLRILNGEALGTLFLGK